MALESSITVSSSLIQENDMGREVTRILLLGGEFDGKIVSLREETGILRPEQTPRQVVYGETGLRLGDIEVVVAARDTRHVWVDGVLEES